MIKKFIEFVRSNWQWTILPKARTARLSAARHDLGYLGVTASTVVTIQFADGVKRKFRIFESGENSLTEGAALRLEFVHPNFCEVMHAQFFTKGMPEYQRIMQ